MDEDIGLQPSVMVLGPSDKLQGFIFGFWGKYVHGFNAREHCQAGLMGPRERRIKREMLTGKEIVLGKQVRINPYFYICGVTSRWRDNFHLACKFEPGQIASAKTYNGFEVTVYEAMGLEIPSLPDGFAGLPKSFTTCRNYQFGVEYFGLPEDFKPPPPKPKKQGRGKAGGGKRPNLEPGEREMRLANFVKKEGEVYLVPSDSSNRIHEVTLGEKPQCTCIHGIHYRFAGARCYHVRAAIAFRDGKIQKALF